jgi:hypothetical protein
MIQSLIFLEHLFLFFKRELRFESDVVFILFLYGTSHFAFLEGVVHIELRATSIAIRWQIHRGPCVAE